MWGIRTAVWFEKVFLKMHVICNCISIQIKSKEDNKTLSRLWSCLLKDSYKKYPFFRKKSDNLVLFTFWSNLQCLSALDFFYLKWYHSEGWLLVMLANFHWVTVNVMEAAKRSSTVKTLSSVRPTSWLQSWETHFLQCISLVCFGNTLCL